MGMLLSTTPDFSSAEYFQKPTIIFDGLHHAREVMTVEVVLDVADTILKNRSRFSQELLKNWNIWVVPMVNPDGSNIVWTENTMWRKNARTGVSDIFGVDVNRNYNYRWGDCQGSSSSKSSQTYRGDGAGSEPETQAIMRLADAVHPTASLSYHSFGELVLFPYGCKGDVTAENTLVQKIGNELADLLPSDSRKGHYTPGTPWQILYAVDGDSMDYMYAAHGALSYTFEMNEDFQPSYDMRDATVAKHRGAWMYFLDRISKNLLTVNVIDGKTGQLSEAIMAVDTITPTKKEWPFRTNRIGKYFKVLDPGSYVISAKLKDGRRGQLGLQMQGQPQVVNLIVD
jgi:carboxypeptidase T